MGLFKYTAETAATRIVCVLGRGASCTLGSCHGSGGGVCASENAGMSSEKHVENVFAG